MNGNPYWLPMDQAPRDGTVVYAFFYQGKPSELRADIRAIRWSGWGGGVWDCAHSGHHIHGADPIMFTRSLPYPDQQLVADIQKKEFVKRMLQTYGASTVDELTPEQRATLDWTPRIEY